MNFKYIIKGDGMMAMPIQSDLNLLEFRQYFNNQIKKIHPKGRDTIWTWGTIEFINPEIMLVDDFVNYLPALIGMKKYDN